MPIFVLTSSLLFSAYLIIDDIRQQKNISNAVWVPLIWLLIMSSRPFSLWVGAGVAIETPDDYLDGSPLDRNLFLILIVLSGIILIKRRISLYRFVSQNTWLSLFLVYGAISILWSDYSFVAFKRWIKVLGSVLIVLVLLTEVDPTEAVRRTIKRIIYIFIPLSIVFIKYYPSLGRFYTPTGAQMLTGVTTNKNTLGVLCMVSFLILCWNMLALKGKPSSSVKRKEIFVHIVLLVMTTWLLFIVNSSTSLACLIIGLSVLVVVRVFQRSVRAFNVFIITVVCLFIVFQYIIDITEIVVSALGRDMTLTGRTDLWQELIEMNKAPWFGTGYESFWLGTRAEYFWDKYWWHPNQAHNGYLETYINLGIVGLGLFLASIGSVYKKIMSKLASDQEFQSLRMALLVIIVISNVTEAHVKGISLMWFIFFLIALEYPRVQSNTSHEINISMVRR